MITTGKLRALTAQHIARYEALAAAGRAGTDPTVDVEDAEHYLRIWRGIEAKDCDPTELAPFERAEVADALRDEGP